MKKTVLYSLRKQKWLDRSRSLGAQPVLTENNTVLGTGDILKPLSWESEVTWAVSVGIPELKRKKKKE